MGPFWVARWISFISTAGPTHSIKARLSAWEGEGEAQRKTCVLHPHVVQEVTDAMYYVIKQL